VLLNLRWVQRERSRRFPMRKLLSQLRGPIFWARTIQIALLCVVSVVMLGAAKSPFERIGHELMCTCGCGQILLECNHVGCTSSSSMINELHTQIDTGLGETAVLNWFAGKYGPTVLAAPIRGGFDNAAWIVPIGVFVLATAGTFVIVWLWKKRAMSLAHASGVPLNAAFPHEDPLNPQDAALRERIRRETEY
jgi:cytochrome c-type biogenesis protein CcmH/NrfF